MQWSAGFTKKLYPFHTKSIRNAASWQLIWTAWPHRSLTTHFAPFLVCLQILVSRWLFRSLQKIQYEHLKFFWTCQFIITLLTTQSERLRQGSFKVCRSPTVLSSTVWSQVRTSNSEDGPPVTGDQSLPLNARHLFELKKNFAWHKPGIQDLNSR